jgi:hypothetical protein
MDCSLKEISGEMGPGSEEDLEIGSNGHGRGSGL